MNAHESKEKEFEETVREKGLAVIIFTKLQVEFKWNVFIFFFHLKIFSSLLMKSSHQRCSIEKAVLKKFTTFAGKNLCLSHFLIKFQVWRPANLLKSESNTDVFLWIFGNFKDEISWRTSANDSFCRQF